MVAENDTDAVNRAVNKTITVVTLSQTMSYASKKEVIDSFELNWVNVTANEYNSTKGNISDDYLTDRKISL